MGNNQSTTPWRNLAFTNQEGEYSANSCLLSKLIYSNGDFYERCKSAALQYSWFRPLKITLSRNNGVDTTRFAIVDFAKFRIVCIKGSTDKIDWLDNFTVETVTDKPYELNGVHRGFLAKSIDIPGEMLYYLNGEMPVIFTGHSQGGAVAELSALRLHKLGITNNVYAISFGAPSFIQDHSFTTSHEFLKNSKGKFLRFFYEDDPVVPSTASFGYVPFEKLIKIDKTNSNLHVVDNLTGSSSKLLNAPQTHDINRYFNSILQFISGNERNVHPQTLLDPRRLDQLCSAEEFNNSTKIESSVFTGDGFFKVTGTGTFAGICRASLTMEDSEIPIVCEDLHYHVVSTLMCTTKICQFSLRFRLPRGGVNLNHTSIVNLKNHSNSMKLHVFNGIDNFELLMPDVTCTKSVAVLGQTGHGKSQLLKGLLAQSHGQRIGQDRAKFGEVAADLAQTFVINGTMYYELGAVSVLDEAYNTMLQEIFSSYPPTVLLVVIKSNERSAEKGLIKFISDLLQRQDREKLPHVYFVVTNDGVVVTEEEWLAEMKDKLHYDQFPKKSLIKVNSAISPKNVQPQHLDVLLRELDQILDDSPPGNPIRVRSWAQFILHCTTSPAGLAVLGGTAVSGIACGVWIAVTKTPPPPALVFTSFL